MPAGLLWRKRALLRRGTLPTAYPRIDLGDPTLRRALLLVAAATLANVGIVGTASYKGVEHMDSVQFCGQSCHSVMAPEFAAYVDSPHSRVPCVQCHIGAGADWFVRSKLSGTRQVLAVALQTYSRPIPSPVRHLRPARETCEQCHWPRKFHGDKLVVKRRYAEDEKNTEQVTVLMLRIGGHGPGGPLGIHGRHLDENERIEYVATDTRRESIAWVRYRDDRGQFVEYVKGGTPPTEAELLAGERRFMDCVDCHNRPTHAFALPHRAVDRALEEGRISRSLPWIKKKAVVALRATYADRDTGSRAIVDNLTAYYRESHPDVWAARPAEVERAAAAVRDIYLRNVFPEMNLDWGYHPNHIGHDDTPGCFRCHDDEHKSQDGRAISQDCEACHAILAQDEEDPKVLADLGLKRGGGQ
jgi:hypothetical protein